jgi:hypothetical protein
MDEIGYIDEVSLKAILKLWLQEDRVTIVDDFNH